ncbi:replication initiator protein [Microviridae sp.]|nr:replication initiator protein [Microviridae sp.]
MVCYSPLQAYRGRDVNPATGKRQIVFNRSEGFADLPVELACGQCVGCRLERSRQWAVRCVHEASLHEENCFITLTYREMPSNGSLNLRHWQLFMKKLRKRFGSGIRFFHCGEYGSKNFRPHYHALLFNFDFPDKKLWQITKQKDRLYRSPALEQLWPYGYSSVGDVTFQSAAYVARYVMKKRNGDDAEKHYTFVDADGVIHDRKPEYVTMSRRPHGIGAKWLEQFKGDVYPSDFLIINGKKVRPPRYYDTRLELEDPIAFAAVKRKRLISGKDHASNNTPERRKVRERIQNTKLDMLKRSL